MPKHVAMIMDGNGRWANKRALPRKFGHRAGVKTLMRIVEHAFKSGIEFVTVYAFSTENKLRPKDEVDALIELIRKHFETTFKKLTDNGICVRVLGERSFFPEDVVAILDKVERDSRDGKTGTFNVALNYGGRAELVRACKTLCVRGEEITEDSISAALYTCDQPDPDVLIRTGGEQRLSNFLLYQCAYSELFFTDTLWPDFTCREFDKIIKDFSKRNRRYGKV